MARISPRRARQKGLEFERFVCQALRCVFPGAQRHLEFQSHQAQGIDIDNTGEYKIQCKKLHAYGRIALIEEVQCDRLMGEIPVLVTAGTNKEPMAVLPLADFINLLKLTKA